MTERTMTDETTTKLIEAALEHFSGGPWASGSGLKGQRAADAYRAAHYSPPSLPGALSGEQEARGPAFNPRQHEYLDALIATTKREVLAEIERRALESRSLPAPAPEKEPSDAEIERAWECWRVSTPKLNYKDAFSAGYRARVVDGGAEELIEAARAWKNGRPSEWPGDVAALWAAIDALDRSASQRARGEARKEGAG